MGQPTLHVVKARFQIPRLLVETQFFVYYSSKFYQNQFAPTYRRKIDVKHKLTCILIAQIYLSDIRIHPM